MDHRPPGSQANSAQKGKTIDARQVLGGVAELLQMMLARSVENPSKVPVNERGW